MEVGRKNLIVKPNIFAFLLKKRTFMRISKTTVLLSLLAVATLSSCSRQYAGRDYVKQKPQLAKEQPRKAKKEVNAVAAKEQSFSVTSEATPAQRVNGSIQPAPAPLVTKNSLKKATAPGASFLAYANDPAPAVNYQQPAVNNNVVADITAKPGQKSGGKSQLVALILAFFLGGLGIHRFYLGYPILGILMIITFGGFGIWWLVDIILIAIGELKPKNGDYTRTWDDY